MEGKPLVNRLALVTGACGLIGLKPPIDVSVTYENPFCAINVVAVLLFAIYPLFLYLGIYIGSKILSKSSV